MPVSRGRDFFITVNKLITVTVHKDFGVKTAADTPGVIGILVFEVPWYLLNQTILSSNH